MGQALVTKKAETFLTMEGFLSEAKTQAAIARVLPTGMTAARLVRYAMAAMTRNPRLLDCWQPSVMMALLDCAYYELEPNPVLGHAYLVPFKNNKANPARTECQMMVGYKGYILLGERSGLLRGTVAAAVYKDDEFRWHRHLQPPFFHDVNIKSRRRTVADIEAVYCATLNEKGFWQGIPLSRGEVERYKQRSRAQNDGPWKTDWDAMAIKTAVRRAYSQLPLSAKDKLGVAIAQDVALELGEPVTTEQIQDGVVEAPELIDRGEQFAASLANEDQNG